MKNKTVLVIGNGFDLNIGKPTSYSKFMASQNFKDLLSEKNCLASYLNNKGNGNNNWINIEKELGNYSTILAEYDTHSIPKEVRYDKSLDDLKKTFEDDFKSLCNALKIYLNEIETKYPLGELDYNSLALRIIKDITMEDKLYFVINFNYTNFIKKVKYLSEKIEIRYIHGSLKNDIVFGVQDKLDLKEEHIFLYKSYNQYQNVQGLPQILENADEIIFFGYSMGVTDHSYFDDFFKAQAVKNCQNKIIKFYYHGQNAYDDIICQLKVLTNNRTSYLKQYNNIQFEDSSITLK